MKREELNEKSFKNWSLVQLKQGLLIGKRFTFLFASIYSFSCLRFFPVSVCVPTGQELSKFVRGNKDNVSSAFLLLLQRLRTSHSQVRLLAFKGIDFLVRKSKMARKLGNFTLRERYFDFQHSQILTTFFLLPWVMKYRILSLHRPRLRS